MRNNSMIGDVVTAAAAAQNIKERDYWLNRLQGELIKTTFPCCMSKTGPQPKESMDSVSFRFTGDIFSQLIKLSNGFDYTLHMILAAGVSILLNKYTGSRDIIIGAPIYKQETTGKFINTILVLRNKIETDMTVKELLLQVRETIVKATENQNYPIETLLYKLDIQSTAGEFPLFDIAVLVENIHNKEYLQNIDLNMIFSFFRAGEYVEGVLEYNSSRYHKTTCDGIIRHFMNLMEKLLFNLDMKVQHLQILAADERKQVLYDFNDTEVEYPSGKTIGDLFEEQAARQPSEPALIFANRNLTYGELSQSTTRLAGFLKSMGVGKEKIAAVMVERSIEMIIGMLGILKAGGAYLPIDSQYPQERIKYMLDDSEVQFLLTQKHLKSRLNIDIRQIDLADESIYTTGTVEEDTHGVAPHHLAYVIYTSGSTGKAKGVAVEHRSIVNTLLWRKDYYRFNQRDVILQVLGFTFDSSVEDIFTTLASGGRLVLVPQANVYDLQYLAKLIKEIGVTYFLIVPGFYKSFLAEIPGSLTGLRAITVAGDNITEKLVEKHFQLLPRVDLYNEYGPTENSVCTTVYQFAPHRTKVLVGKPISNVKCYILDAEGQPTPLGVPGELYAAGKGLSRGYLKRPQLTKEKFVDNPFGPGEKMYRTGDMVRWLTDGNIEFLGRIDFQVKIRGFRIELGEIENQLLKNEEISEALVIARDGAMEESGVINEGDKYLCAYVVSQKKLDYSIIKNNLAENLPEYMIPPYLLQIEKIPLTPNGKIDRKALPRPERGIAGKYTAPRDRIEKRLVEIWSELLKIDKGMLGIDVNFFESGGHSLVATILVSKITKEFNIKVPMAVIFEKVTIRELSQYIKAGRQEKFDTIEPVETREYYEVSSAQQRLYVLQQMDPGSTHYDIPITVFLEGEVEVEKIEEVFKTLIARHESLRTSFVIIKERPVQRIHPRVDFRILYSRVESGEVDMVRFAVPFDLSRAPLLNVRLIKKADFGIHILHFQVHHIVTDGISMEILKQEFIEQYQGKALSPLKLQYRDFSSWQAGRKQQVFVKQQEEYWLNTLAGELPVLDLPLDKPRPTVQAFDGDRVASLLSETQTAALKKMAKDKDMTLYMVMLSVFTLLLCKMSGQEDIIGGTPIAGRRHADLDKIVGMFVNTLVMRNYPVGDITLNLYLEEVKVRTLEAYENQEYPFDDLVGLLAIPRDTSRNPIFDVMLDFIGRDFTDATGFDPEYQEKKKFLKEKKLAKFDLTLTVSDYGEKISLGLEYCTRLFKRETIERVVKYFKNLVSIVTNPLNAQKKLGEIGIMEEEEKNRVLEEFNRTRVEYPGDKTIPRLFEEQVERTPNQVALIGPKLQNAVTYKELDERCGGLTGWLIEKGVQADTIVGIMMERSVEMVIGILGILKSGGAYMPMDPEYPQERIQYMLKDSSVGVLLTTPKLQVKVKAEVEENSRQPGLPLQFVHIHTNPAFASEPSLSTLTSTLICQVSPANLAYIIYTSGSTGKPKGVMVEQSSVVNLLFALQGRYPLRERDTYLLKTSYLFDVSVTELFGWFLDGGRLAVLAPGGEKDPQAILDMIVREGVSHINFVPSMFHTFVEVLEPRDIAQLAGLKYILLAGEVLLPGPVDRFRSLKPSTAIAIENIYGPTETAVYTSWYSLAGWQGEGSIPIGIPLPNVKLYILDKWEYLQPIGVPGELCIGGVGLARGYLNKPEFTGEKFTFYRSYRSYGSYMTYKSKKLYHTGDLARWLADGNVEYLGRMDFQVKVRGFRIELGEIEHLLFNHQEVKEAVVTAHSDRNGDSFLCAYVVFFPGMLSDFSGLKDYLSQKLPGYMIPAYFVSLPGLPLTSSGKIDRLALPLPEVKSTKEYIPPRNELETGLVNTWSGLLGIDRRQIGIDDNFFELGGHSLKASVLVSRIEKAFEVKVPLSQIFKNPRIRGLAGYIKEAVRGKYEQIVSVEKKEYYGVSSAQKRLYAVQQRDPDSTVYNMLTTYVVGEGLSPARIESVMRELIDRHESLRTSFEVVEEEPVQRVHQGVEFVMTYDDRSRRRDIPAGSENQGQILERERIDREIKDFVRPFELSRAPLLRAGMIKIAGGICILMVDIHHIIFDGISQNVLTGDFWALCRGEKMPVLELHYKDFSQWRSGMAGTGEMKKQEEYWIREFKDYTAKPGIPTDYPRPRLQSFAGDTYDFEIEGQETARLKEIAQREGVTLYMVLLAIYNVLVSKLSGQEDIVVGTGIFGRRQTGLENIIGIFVNTLALRNYPTGEKTFKEFLGEVGQRTLNAFENQDYLFEDLVEKIYPHRDPSRNPLFDTVFMLDNLENGPGKKLAGENRGTPLQPYGYKKKETPFDMIFNCVEMADRLRFSVGYSTALFKRETVELFTRGFKQIIAAVADGYEVAISSIMFLPGVKLADTTLPGYDFEF